MDARDDIIDRIYEAAIVPELWPDVLDRLAALSQTLGGILFAVAPGGRMLADGLVPDVARWTSSETVRRQFTTFLAEGWMDRNSRAERGLRLAHAGFITDLDLYTPEEMETEPLCRYVRELGLGWCAGLTVQVPSGDTIIFDLERRYEEGPVSRATIEALDPLAPHLTRAALMASRLGLERAKAATEALALLGLPAAVLSSRHSLVAANGLMQGLMPGVLEERAAGRLHLVDRAADKLFSVALDQARRGESRDHLLSASSIFSVPMPAREDRSAMVVHVVPVRRAARDVFARASAVVIVTPVCRADVPTATVIQGLFDLTAAEASVARRLAGGETVGEIAARSRTSEGTVRSQLKAVFAKTGVRRQAELVSLLGNLAPGRGIAPV